MSRFVWEMILPAAAWAPGMMFAAAWMALGAMRSGTGGGGGISDLRRLEAGETVVGGVGEGLEVARGVAGVGVGRFSGTWFSSVSRVLLRCESRSFCLSSSRLSQIWINGGWATLVSSLEDCVFFFS